MLVLHTIGHTSGRPRRAPLGYALVDGRVVVVAGYGRATHWFRNALAHPDVEVTLPGSIIAGRAEEITDPGERRRAFRAVVLAEGVVGRLTVGDLTNATDERLNELAEGLPLLAITPHEIRPGPFDPGGGYWKYSLAELVLAGAAVVGAWRLGSARARSRISQR
jgi:deazaflavin-dependent oxidoreductase (nitroreductase family)